MKKITILILLTLLGLSKFLEAQIPTDGLKAYYPFSGNANDYSGNNYDGTVNSAVLSTDRFNNENSSYYFDGYNDYINCNNPLLPSDGSDWAISLWFKSNSPNDNNHHVIFSQYYVGIGRFHFMDINDSLYVFSSNFDTTMYITDIDTNWNFLEINCMNNFLSIYYNNSLEAENILIDNIIIYNSKIGMDTHADRSFKGKIDDIRIFNRILNESEITALFYENVCSDIITNDTIINFVSSIDFASISPRVYLETVDSLSTIVGGCDSIVYHYSEYLFDANYFTDTIEVFDTTVVYDTLTTEIFDTTIVYDTLITEVFDTTIVYDTLTTEVFDTTFVTVYDSIAVTDTLIIDVTITGISPPNNENTIKIYPNPTNDVIYINTGSNYQNMSDYTLKIVNTLGQTVFENLINSQLFTVDVSTFGATGLYYVHIIDYNSQIIDIRKIILK